jgi:methyl-accepting chemotaxis protein
VTAVFHSIQSAEGVIESLAAHDMNQAFQSKQRAEDTMTEIKAVNQKIAQGADTLKGSAQEMYVNVNHAIQSLQFQDLVSQLLEHLLKRFSMLEVTCQGLQQMKDAPPDGLLSLLVAMQSQMKASSNELAKNPVVQASVSSGNIDLF